MDVIHVGIRVRPVLPREKSAKLKSMWQTTPQSITGGSKTYYFDHVFDESYDTSAVYDKMGRPLVEKSMQGFHATLFLYGQTASGKTHTVMGDDANPGILPLAIQHVFDYIQMHPEREFLLRVSYLEIYNEEITDLISNEKGLVSIRSNANNEVVTENLTEETVTSFEDTMSIVHRGQAYRHIGCTNMNERSSRSHCVFRLVIESREITPTDDLNLSTFDSAVIVSHLNLIDLAGSERAGQTGATGQRLKEAGYINLSLLTLGIVISKLAENDGSRVPYRDSKLTRILQNSLGGNANTVIICAVSPVSLEDTDHTLRFASRAKTIKNKPIVNEVLNGDTMLKRYKQEIRSLKMKLMEFENSVPSQLLEEKDKMLAEQQALHEQQRDKFNVMLKQILCSGRAVQKKPAIRRMDRRQTWCPGAHVTNESSVLEETDLLAKSVQQNLQRKHRLVSACVIKSSDVCSTANSTLEFSQFERQFDLEERMDQLPMLSKEELVRTINERDLKVDVCQSKIKELQTQLEELTERLSVLSSDKSASTVPMVDALLYEDVKAQNYILEQRNNELLHEIKRLKADSTMNMQAIAEYERKEFECLKVELVDLQLAKADADRQIVCLQENKSQQALENERLHRKVADLRTELETNYQLFLQRETSREVRANVEAELMACKVSLQSETSKTCSLNKKIEDLEALLFQSEARLNCVFEENLLRSVKFEEELSTTNKQLLQRDCELKQLSIEDHLNRERLTTVLKENEQLIEEMKLVKSQLICNTSRACKDCLILAQEKESLETQIGELIQDLEHKEEGFSVYKQECLKEIEILKIQLQDIQTNFQSQGDALALETDRKCAFQLTIKNLQSKIDECETERSAVSERCLLLSVKFEELDTKFRQLMQEKDDELGQVKANLKEACQQCSLVEEEKANLVFEVERLREDINMLREVQHVALLVEDVKNEYQQRIAELLQETNEKDRLYNSCRTELQLSTETFRVEIEKLRSDNDSKNTSLVLESERNLHLQEQLRLRNSLLHQRESEVSLLVERAILSSAKADENEGNFQKLLEQKDAELLRLQIQLQSDGLAGADQQRAREAQRDLAKLVQEREELGTRIGELVQDLEEKSKVLEQCRKEAMLERDGLEKELLDLREKINAISDGGKLNMDEETECFKTRLLLRESEMIKLQEQNVLLLTSVDEIRGQCSQVAQEKNALEIEFSNLREKLAYVASEFSKEAEAKSCLESQLEQVKAKLENYETELEVLANATLLHRGEPDISNEQAADFVSACNVRIHELQEELNLNINDRREAERQKDALSLQVEDLKKELSLVRNASLQEEALLKQTLEHRKQLLLDLELETTKEKNAFEEHILSLTNEVLHKGELLSFQSEVNNALTQQLKAVQLTLSEREADMKELVEENKSLCEKIDQMQANLKSQLRIKDEELSDIKGRLLESEEKLCAAVERSNVLAHEVDAAKINENSLANSTHSALQATIHEKQMLEARVNELLQKVEQHENAFALYKEISAAEKAVLKQEIVTLKSELDVKMDMLSRETEADVMSREQVEALQLKLSKREADMKELAEGNRSLCEKIDQMQANVKSQLRIKDEELSDIKGRLLESEEKLCAAVERSNVLANEVDAAKMNEISLSNSAHSALQATVHEKQMLEARVNELLQKVEQHENAFALCKESFAEEKAVLKQEIFALKSELDGKMDMLSREAEASAILRERMETLQLKFSEREADIKELSEGNRSLCEKFDQIQASMKRQLLIKDEELSEIKGRLLESEEKLCAAVKRSNVLAHELDAAKMNENSLSNSTHSALQGTIHEKQMLEARVNELLQKVEQQEHVFALYKETSAVEITALKQESVSLKADLDARIVRVRELEEKAVTEEQKKRRLDKNCKVMYPQLVQLNELHQSDAKKMAELLEKLKAADELVAAKQLVITRQEVEYGELDKAFDKQQELFLELKRRCAIQSERLEKSSNGLRYAFERYKFYKREAQEKDEKLAALEKQLGVVDYGRNPSRITPKKRKCSESVEELSVSSENASEKVVLNVEQSLVPPVASTKLSVMSSDMSDDQENILTIEPALVAGTEFSKSDCSVESSSASLFASKSNAVSRKDAKPLLSAKDVSADAKELKDECKMQ